MEIVLIASLILVVIVNMAASLYISKAPAYERSQKQIQIVLIWVLPIIGALFFSYFLWIDRMSHKLEKQIGNNTTISNSDAVHHYFGTNHRGGR
jgi:hypothetical protein